MTNELSMPNELSRSSVVALITQAFSNQSYPGDDNIGAEPPGVCWETDTIVKFFRGKHWTKITLHDLREDYEGDSSACLSFMTPEAYRFYVPSYMLIALSDYYEADVTADSALNSFIPPGQSSAAERQWWNQRVGGFLHEQREVIIVFLEYMQKAHAEDYPIHGPIEALRYWKSKNRD